MCVASMIGDHYGDKFRQWPTYDPIIQTPVVVHMPPEITRAEFEQLKRDVTEMKELLRKAKDYDERNNEPECEVDEKMDLLRKVAKLVGIDLDDVIAPPTSAA